MVSETGADWDDYLDVCLFSMRTERQTSTKVSPFEIMFGGRPPKFEEDFNESIVLDGLPSAEAVETAMNLAVANIEKATKLVKRNIEVAQEKQKNAYDKRMRATAVKRDFKEGEMVLLANQSKRKGLKPRFKGPFIVESVTPHGNIKLRDDKHSHHPKHLKKFNEAPEPTIIPTEEIRLDDLDNAPEPTIIPTEEIRLDDLDNANILDHDYACKYQVTKNIQKEFFLIDEATEGISDTDILKYCVPETTTRVSKTKQADVPESIIKTNWEETNSTDNAPDTTIKMGEEQTNDIEDAPDTTIKIDEEQTNDIEDDEMKMDSNKPIQTVCFCGGTAYEQMLALKSSIESKKIIISRFPEFASLPLTDVLLKDALHSSVNDEVIYIYLQILARESNNKSVKIITPGEMTYIFDTFVSKKQRDISKYDLIVGCRCDGYHWTLSVVIPSAATIIFFNPMGELSKEVVKVKQQWNLYLSAKYGIAESFRVEIVPHARQQDSVSCGIFCLKFAECLILENEEVPKVWKIESVQVYRQHIVKRLVEEGGQEQWCSEICRACGKAEGPKVQGKPTDSWVCCDTCSPARWYHEQCLNHSLRKEYRHLPFNCSMLKVAPAEFNQELWTVEGIGEEEVVIVKETNNEKVAAAVKKNDIEVDDGWFIIKPTNNYMRKCAGCGGSFANTDMCLMTKKLRLIRGEKAPHGKKKETNIHYHIDKKCLGRGFCITKVINPMRVYISQAQFKSFKRKGVDLKNNKNL